MANIFESSAPQEGSRATETTHRRIELQSPADLAYLIANVSKAAREKIDKHLPPDAAPEGEDLMRQRVEQLVDDYIRETFRAAKDNITVNGMSTAELEDELAKAQEGEELEPFDAKLAHRIQTLSTHIEHQTLQLANLRRKAPQDTARQFIQAFEHEGLAYERRWKRDREQRLQAAQATAVEIDGVARVEEMRDSWRRGTEELGRLNEGIGGTVEKMERARKAVWVVQEKET